MKEGTPSPERSGGLRRGACQGRQCPALSEETGRPPHRWSPFQEEGRTAHSPPQSSPFRAMGRAGPPPLELSPCHLKGGTRRHPRPLPVAGTSAWSAWPSCQREKVWSCWAFAEGAEGAAPSCWPRQASSSVARARAAWFLVEVVTFWSSFSSLSWVWKGESAFASPWTTPLAGTWSGWWRW